ncbi:protein kintoun [Stigmatopora argus]
MDIREKLKELNMTADEVTRLTKAFKDEKFREMFNDYAEELSNPENRKIYEEEITILEQERGNNIEFIHPKPFRSLRTSVNRNQKCYINICGNDKVGKPQCTAAVSDDGRRGQSWALPHNLHPGRQETDPKGNKIMIYDVIFHPDTLHIANKKAEFMEMVSSTAIQGIQDAFKVTLDKNNVREMTTKYKGTPRPCVTRKPIPGYPAKPPEENPLAFPYPEEKNTNISPDPKPKCFEVKSETTKKPTEPSYTVKYRSYIDLQDFRCSRDSGKSPRPKEIVVTIDVPLLKSVADANLEVREKSLLLESEKPDYRLELPLSYPVDEERGGAKFSKQKGQLTVTLPVLPSNEAMELCWGKNEEEVGVQKQEMEAEDSQALEEDVRKVKGQQNGDVGEEEKLTGKGIGQENVQEEHRVEEKREKGELFVQKNGELDLIESQVSIEEIKEEQEPQSTNHKECRGGIEKTLGEYLGAKQGVEEERREVEGVGGQYILDLKETTVKLNKNECREDLREEEQFTREKECKELVEKVQKVEKSKIHEMEGTGEPDTLSTKENQAKLIENEHLTPFQEEEYSTERTICKELMEEEQEVEELKKHKVEETGQQDGLTMKENLIQLHENENQAPLEEEEHSLGRRTCEELVDAKQEVEEKTRNEVEKTGEQNTLSIKENQVKVNENKHQVNFVQEELSIEQRTWKEPVEVKQEVGETKKVVGEETGHQDAFPIKENEEQNETFNKQSQVNLNKIEREDQVREGDEAKTIDLAQESSSPSGDVSHVDAFLDTNSHLSNALMKETTMTQEKNVQVDEPCGEAPRAEKSLKNNNEMGETADKTSYKGGDKTRYMTEESATLSTKDEALPEKQITQKPKADEKLPPASLREIDKDGNVTVFSNHVTSAGFLFQNSLIYELD